MNTLNAKLPPLKKRKPSKKIQGKKNEIKINMQTTNQNCNEWKFQIHRNKLEWEIPRNRNEQNNPFCVYSKKIRLKDNTKTAH